LFQSFAMTVLDKMLAAFGFTKPTMRSTRRKDADDLASRRTLVRKRQRLQDAFIVSEKMIKPRPCTLLDMTPLGGAVEIWDETLKAGLLTGELTLYLPADRKEVLCAVAWRKENSLGLKFLTPMREATRAYR
jgi:hypothetical protein